MRLFFLQISTLFFLFLFYSYLDLCYFSMKMYAAFILPLTLTIIHIILSLKTIQRKGFWLKVLLKEKRLLGGEKQPFISAAEGNNSIEDGALPRMVIVSNWGPAAASPGQVLYSNPHRMVRLGRLCHHVHV